MSTLRNAVTRRRGMVLIIVLSVLAVMAILGISLLTLSHLDRTVTDNHLHYVQARQMAKSGVEDAMARLREGGVLRSAFDTENEWQYRGNDIDGKDEAKRLVPVAWGQLPSFPKKGANGLAEMVELWRDDQKATVKVGVSGVSPGRFHPRSNVYSVEVRDLSSCIYLNDGVHLYGANNSSVSQNLRRILNRLGENSKVGIGQLGDLVLRLRPSTGFASLQDFRTVMKTKGHLQDLQLDRLERYVTTVAWIDKNVVNPAPLSHATVKHYPVTYERGGDEAYMYRRGPGRDNENEDRSLSSRLGWMPDFGGITGAGGVSTKVFAQDELYPTYIEVTHRAPVNINTAEEPVLIALLSDLKGFYILEKRSAHPFGGDLPKDFSYSYLWPTQNNLVNQQGGGWVKGNPNTWNVSQGWFTFENMGHTYSDRPWKARVSVDDKTEWYELWGGTSNSTSSSFELVEDHDALGELWITPAIQSGDGSGTVAGGVSARAIAQEIIACRNKTGRYQNSPFGGAFRSWAQFYAFCDNLVEVRRDGQPGAGILRDERHGKVEDRRQASQALADVLKANFNPNFTPNETNPDHNLYLSVDKTDLVVNSTEFCFLPTGLFSITSVGRVLRDFRGENDTRKSDKDSGSGAQEIVAQSRFDAVVRAYEVYRETSQRHFYSGEATPAQDCSYTNNGQTVETGPEPDNGPLLYLEHLGHGAKFIRHTPDLDGYAGDTTIEGEIMSGWGYEASGYLALPTRGGIATMKRKGEILKPLANGEDRSEWDKLMGVTGANMRASFRLNDTLDYSSQGGNKEYNRNAATEVLSAGGDPDLLLISEYVYNPATCSGQVVTRQAGGSIGKPRVEQASNFADPGEEGVEGDGGVRLSPYDPTDGTRYRLARSYRLPLSISPGAVGAGQGKTMSLNQQPGGTSSLPRMLKAAPSDLRVDGYYVERNAGLAYWLDESPEQTSNFCTFQSTASFWFKPGFDPAYTGKVRSLASVSRYHRKNFYYRNPSPFTLYFMPAHRNGDGTKYTTAGDTIVTAPSTANPAHKLVHADAKKDMRHLTSLPKSSLVFQVAYSTFDGTHWGYEYDWTPPPNNPNSTPPISPGKLADVEAYYVTDSLNKKALDGIEDQFDALRAHHWTHLTMTWKLHKHPNPYNGGLSSQQPEMKVLVNGVAYNQVNATNPFFGVWPQKLYTGLANPSNGVDSLDKRARMSDFDFFDHEIGPDGTHKDDRFFFPGDRHTPIETDADRMFIANTFRLGEVSTHSFQPDTFNRNFSSDGTYDEFYFWVGAEPAQMGDTGLAAMANPQNLAGKKFAQGRYYVPTKSDTDSVWTSPDLVLRGPAANRELAGPTKNVATGGGIRADKPSGVGLTTTEGTKTTVRLLGVAWTWYAEKYNSEIAGNTLGGNQSLVPVMVDYQDPKSPADLRQDKSCARLFVTVNDLKYPVNDPIGYANDAFSAIQDASGQAVSLGEDGKFRYQVQFQVEGADTGSVLLSTPVLDDVTFYYLTPGTPFLQYVERSEIE